MSYSCHNGPKHYRGIFTYPANQRNLPGMSSSFLQLRERLNKLEMVLASQSPRRAEILTQLGLKLRACPSSFEENLDKTQYTPEQYVEATARHKALDVFAQQEQANLVVSADTVVVLNEKILEKPKTRAEAVQMLTALSGKVHTVCTGVTLAAGPRGVGDKAADTHEAATAPAEKKRKVAPRSPAYLDSFHVCTEVKFADLSAAEINAYVDTGEPMDKAGGYGIQAQGAVLVDSIRGCYFNVMGFPARRFAEAMIGVRPRDYDSQLSDSNSNRLTKNMILGYFGPLLLRALGAEYHPAYDTASAVLLSKINMKVSASGRGRHRSLASL
eukprot:g61493.t1